MDGYKQLVGCSIFLIVISYFHDVRLVVFRLFGLILFATECNVNFVLEKVGFLRSLLGRGVFNILYMYV